MSLSAAWLCGVPGIRSVECGLNEVCLNAIGSDGGMGHCERLGDELVHSKLAAVLRPTGDGRERFANRSHGWADRPDACAATVTDRIQRRDFLSAVGAQKPGLLATGALFNCPIPISHCRPPVRCPCQPLFASSYQAQRDKPLVSATKIKQSTRTSYRQIRTPK